MGLGITGPILNKNLVYIVQSGDWTVDQRLDQLPSRGPRRAKKLMV